MLEEYLGYRVTAMPGTIAYQDGDYVGRIVRFDRHGVTVRMESNRELRAFRVNELVVVPDIVSAQECGRCPNCNTELTADNPIKTTEAQNTMRVIGWRCCKCQIVVPA